jgi:hypothetical protein
MPDRAQELAIEFLEGPAPGGEGLVFGDPEASIVDDPKVEHAVISPE